MSERNQLGKFKKKKDGEKINLVNTEIQSKGERL